MDPMNASDDETLLGPPTDPSGMEATVAAGAGISGDEATLAGGPTPAAPAGPSATSRPLGAGDKVGRYEVIDTIGAGGMGAVYLARDPELGREVAVKVVRRHGQGTAGEQEQARLQREAQAMAAVSPPNLITVFDVGRRGDDVFIAMEYIRGDTLKTWARGRDWREVLEAYLDAGRGLAAAHAAGIVHRDFKPDNVLVGGQRAVKVLDFGLAAGDLGGPPTAGAEDGEDDPDALRLTRTGAVMGTPAYMSPEQFEGAATDGRSDQFSFAVALWEALYGQRPFAGESFATLAHGVLSGEVVPVPTSEVPKEVHAALRRALSRRPEDRFEDMDALLAALAIPEPAEHPTVPWVMIGTGALVLAAGVAWASGALRPTPPEPPPVAETRGDETGETPTPDPALDAAERALLEVLLAPGEDERAHRAEEYLETHGASGGPARAAIAHGVIGDVEWRSSCPSAKYDLCLDIQPPPEGARCRLPTTGPILRNLREAESLARATEHYRSVVMLAESEPPEDPSSAARFRDAVAIARIRLADLDLEPYLADAPGEDDLAPETACGARDEDCRAVARAEAFASRTSAAREALLSRYGEVVDGPSDYGAALALARRGLVWEGLSEPIYLSAPDGGPRGKAMKICGPLDESGAREARVSAQKEFVACSERATEKGLSKGIIGLCDARSSALAKLDKVGIKATMRDAHEQLVGCMNDYTERTGEQADGRVVVRLAIGPGGKVTSASSADETTAPDELAVCVVGVVKGLQFADPGGTVFVNYPFNLRAKPK